MSDKNKVDQVYVAVKPDFDTVKKYVLPEMLPEEFEKEKVKYESAPAVALPFLTSDEGREYVNNLNAIIEKYGLDEHFANLGYIVTYMYSTVIPTLFDTDYLRQSSSLVSELDETLAILINNPEKEFTISFQEKTGPPRPNENGNRVLSAKITHGLASKWVISLIAEAIKANKMPLRLGVQLLNARITEVEGLYVNDTPISAFVRSTETQLGIDAISNVSLILISYLENETKIKRKIGKRWSYMQLSLVLEVLYLFRLKTPSTKLTFKFGRSSPLNKDKDALDKLLTRKLFPT